MRCQPSASATMMVAMQRTAHPERGLRRAACPLPTRLSLRAESVFGVLGLRISVLSGPASATTVHVRRLDNAALRSRCAAMRRRDLREGSLKLNTDT